MPRHLTTPLALAAILLACWQGPAHAARDWSLAEATDLVDALRSRIRSIYYEAEVAQRVATIAGGAERRQHINFAAEGERRFHEAGHYVDNLRWDEEPMWVRHFLQPDRIDLVWPLSRVAWASRKDADPIGNTKLRLVYYEHYINNIGWWPPNSSPGRAGSTPESCLHRVVRHPNCRVLPGTVTVDGRSCIRLHVEDRDETVDLDPGRGGVLVRRRFRLPDGSRTITENRAFREVAPGTWLPTETRQVIFRGDHATIKEVPEASAYSSSNYQLARIEINRLPEDQFNYRPIAGTIIQDRDAGRATFIPGGTDLVDDVVRSARKRIEPKSPAPAASGTPTIAICSVSLLLTMAPWFVKVRRPD